MSDRSDGWEKRIKENMRPLNVNGGKSIYELSDKKNKSVEIHFGAINLMVPPQRNGQPSKRQPAVGQGSDTLDISSADFLIVNRHATVLKCRQFIPWKKIVEMVFLDT